MKLFIDFWKIFDIIKISEHPFYGDLS
jgi:hypothetical protein